MAVYFIRAGAWGDVKIGVANDPLARLKQLQTGIATKLRIIRVVEGDREAEKMLHERFKHARKVGEWFSFNEAMLGEIGLPDLPIPVGKREARYDPSDPSDRYRQLQSDLIEVVGKDELVRALGVAPWKASWYVEKEYLSALVVLARAAGARVTFPEVWAARKEADAAYRARCKQSNKDQRAGWDRKAEAEWLQANPGAPIYWKRFTDDDQSPAEPVAAAAE